MKMNPYTLNLIICIAGTAMWISVTVLFSIWISAAKKRLVQEGLTADKASKSYVICIIVCGIVCALPYLILFKPYITGILEGCGVMGTWSVMKERLEKIKKTRSEGE